MIRQQKLFSKGNDDSFTEEDPEERLQIEGSIHQGLITGERKKPKDNRMLAIVMVNIFALTFTGMGVCFKLTIPYNLSVGDFQIYRAAFMFVVMTSISPCLQKSPCRDLPKSNKWVILVQILFRTAAFLLYNISLTILPLAIVMVLNNVAPFWTSVAAYLFNGEKMFPLEYLAMGVCLSLVIALALATEPEQKDDALVQTVTTNYSTLTGVITCIAGSMCLSGQQIANRRLQGTSFVVINWWHSVIGFVLPVIAFGAYAWATNATFLIYAAPCYIWIFLGSICDSVAATCNCIAFQNDNSSFISILAYSSVVFAFIFDIIIFKQIPNSIQLLCALGILVVTFFMALYKFTHTKQ